MKFTLEIQLGNDAMQNGADVAELLRKVAARIESNPFDSYNDDGEFGGVLKDRNGNTVGKWEV